MGESIGNRIETVLKEKGMSQVWLASKIGRVKQNVGNIFTRKSIDTELLQKISIALDHDFFAELSRESGFISPNELDSEFDVMIQVKVKDPGKKAELLKLSFGNEIMEKLKK